MNPFLLGVFVSRLGDAFSFLAMILILSKLGAGNSLVSLFMVAHYLPGVLIGTWGRRWFDRLSKRNTLILTYVVSAGLTLSTTLALGSPWLLLATSILLGIAYGVYVPLQKAFIAEVFPPGEIRRANSAVQVAETLAKTLGFGLAGLVFHRVGPTLSFSLDAVSFIAIALLFTRIPLSSPISNLQKAATQSSHQGHDLKDQVYDCVVSVFALTWIGTGSLFALEAGYARTYLQASEAAIGGLFACATLGSLLVPYLLARTRFQYGLRWIALVCACEAIFISSYGAVSTWIPATVFIVAYGCALTARHILTNSWIHQRIPQAHHGSAFAMLQARANLAMMLGMGLSGPISEWIGIRPTVIGASALSIAGILFTTLRMLQKKAGIPFEIPASLFCDAALNQKEPDTF
jgi:MFS family permease